MFLRIFLGAALLAVVSLEGCSSEGFVPRCKETTLDLRRTPTLSWNPFPTADYEVLRERITDVSYDLRIWKAYQPARYESAPETLVYSRVGLAGPRHRVEDSLEEKTSYVWAVRARFKLEGEWRVSPWSTATGWDRNAELPVRGYAGFCTGPR
jgi:hypothetical protein